MNNLVKCSLALVALFAVAGCGSQVVEFAEAVADEPAPPTPTDPGCLDENCPLGHVCRDNVCALVEPCEGVSCPDGSVCKDGACVVVDLCAGVQCPEGSVCTAGTCSPVDPCAGVQCPENATCQDGTCVPNDPCAGVVCPESRVCRDGVCVCDGDDTDEKECRPGKALICHRAGRHGKKVQLCVSVHAVPAHLKHGDKLGDCDLCH